MTDDGSILRTLRVACDLEPDDDDFDVDIKLSANLSFLALHRQGIGPKKIFAVKDVTNTWSDFEIDDQYIETVKSYVATRANIAVNGGSMSAATLAEYKSFAREAEWTLMVELSSGE